MENIFPNSVINNLSRHNVGYGNVGNLPLGIVLSVSYRVHKLGGMIPKGKIGKYE